MNNIYPYFSIILPVYNREKVISEAIESVLAQSIQSWELIIVDDFSSDDTNDQIKNYSDPRIKLISNSQNKGPAYSRNVGISAAKGRIISFLDSDDRYSPNFLSETYDTFQFVGRDVGFVWTGLEVNYGGITKIEIWNPTIDKSTYHTFLKNLRIGTNSGLSIKKEVFKNCGLFNDTLKAAEDTEFLFRIARDYQFSVIKKPLIYIDKTGKDRLSKDYSKIGEAYNLFISKHWTYISEHRDLKNKYSYKLMWLNYHLGDRDTARKYFRHIEWKFNKILKPLLIFGLFEIFGKQLGKRIHIVLSK